MYTCCDCENFEAEAMHGERGYCPWLAECVQKMFDVRLAGPVMIRGDSRVCEGFGVEEGRHEGDEGWLVDGLLDDDGFFDSSVV